MKIMRHNIKLITLAISFLLLSYIGIQLLVPYNISSFQMEVEIPEGATYKEALNILADNKLIRDKNMFVVFGRLTGLDKKIRAGFYTFVGNMTPIGVFMRLIEGRIVEYEITIIEGDSLLEIGTKLSQNNIVSADFFELLSKDRALLARLNINAPSLEGYIFPQTYKFPKGIKPEYALILMVNKLRKEFTDEMKHRLAEIGWSENEILTLASIIEREAKTDEERPLISAVYHNRIKMRMPLQADPTAIYGLKSFREKITRSDLKKKTLYNTYLINGLPPGPITSPGLKSINAALYPANVPYLYFVSKRDGTHLFSRTYEEHKAAIRQVREMAENKEKDAIESNNEEGS